MPVDPAQFSETLGKNTGKLPAKPTENNNYGRNQG
jgi:hypothetical protein